MLHIPVLYQETLNILHPKPQGKYVDCTVGAGGHSKGILESSFPSGILLGIDLDSDALTLAQENLASEHQRVNLIHGSYVDIENHLQTVGWTSVDGILLDLGVSSMQLDDKTRGFSFRGDAKLNMRFDHSAKFTAYELLNNWSAMELSRIFFNYAEEKKARKLAAAIVEQRPIETTTQFLFIIEEVLGRNHRKKHPAARIFQAVRIAVNQELEGIRNFLPSAVEALSPGGRLVVITYHSLEDRIIKHYFRKLAKECSCPIDQPICTCDQTPYATLITKKPLKPTTEEIDKNPRSRSAKLRAIEKN